jgi:hypothetical protein
MARKILVQMPSYVYLDLPPQVMQLVLNATCYEYKYKTSGKHYFPDPDARVELRVVDENDIDTMPYVEEVKPE